MTCGEHEEERKPMNISSMLGGGGGRMPDLSAIKEKMFQKTDANGDKAVSFDEFQAARKNMPIGKNIDDAKAKETFGKIDKDGNGSLSRDEMSSFGDKMSSQMQNMMLSMQSLMGDKAGGGFDINAMFGKADADRSGGISRDEFSKVGQTNPLAALLKQNENDTFAKIDSDGDGSLSKEEMKSFIETMKKQMEQQMSADAKKSEMMQALTAYKQGLGGNGTDMTKKVIDLIGGQKGTNGVNA
jgi:Ca2+-binding EF-hand superfamily protein